MLNPGFLFQDWEVSDWVRFIPYNSSFAFHLKCGCTMSHQYIKNINLMSRPAEHTITLKPCRFSNGREDVLIHAGVCPKCKVGFWCSESFAWVFWMTDEQQFLCLLESGEKLKYTRREYETGNTAITLLDSRPNDFSQHHAYLIFEKGNFKRIIYAE